MVGNLAKGRLPRFRIAFTRHAHIRRYLRNTRRMMGDLGAMLRGLQRGAAPKADLGDGWDFWEWVALPLEEARARLGVPPLEAGPAGA